MPLHLVKVITPPRCCGTLLVLLLQRLLQHVRQLKKQNTTPLLLLLLQRLLQQLHHLLVPVLGAADALLQQLVWHRVQPARLVEACAAASRGLHCER